MFQFFKSLFLKKNKPCLRMEQGALTPRLARQTLPLLDSSNVRSFD